MRFLLTCFSRFSCFVRRKHHPTTRRSCARTRSSSTRRPWCTTCRWRVWLWRCAPRCGASGASTAGTAPGPRPTCPRPSPCPTASSGLGFCWAPSPWSAHIKVPVNRGQGWVGEWEMGGGRGVSSFILVLTFS